ncbi:MAG: hypothetical protein EGQ00_09145 [Parabacteroides johnsonii]|nr:hypothetical protein [Parabacteroides johnsonii]
MKSEKILISIILSMFFANIGLVSCSKENTLEIVKNPLEEEVYYIVGKLNQGYMPVEDVAVSASGVTVKTSQDGMYQLPVKKKGDYVVSFTKDGYIPLTSSVTIPGNMHTGSTVSLPLQMTKKNATITIDPSKDTVIIYPGTDKLTSIIFPAGITNKPIEVSATEFINGAMENAKRASFSTFELEISGMEGTLPVEIKNQAHPLIRVGNIVQYAEIDGQWTLLGDVSTFDWGQNVLKTTIQSSYVKHSIGPVFEIVSTDTSLESLGEVTIDNLGNLSSKEVEVMVKQKMGWDITTNMDDYYSIYPGLVDDDCKYTTATLYRVLASINGSLFGIDETDLSLGVAKVSGDTKMEVKCFARVEDITFRFILFFQGIWVTHHISIKKYSGVNVEFDYQYGPNHTGNQE